LISAIVKTEPVSFGVYILKYLGQLSKHFIMKNQTVLVFIILCLFSCKSSTNQQETKPMTSSPRPDWLLGKWQRTNDEEYKKTYEQWQKVNDTLYMGLGFAMQGNDTISKENMHIFLKDTVWNCDVYMPGDATPTSFVFTEHTDTSFVCENAQNEFPKKIAYTLKRDTIRATISGGGPEILYLFVKE